MPYKFSRCISFQTSESIAAVEFYRAVLGFEVVEKLDMCVELRAGQNRIFVESGESPVTVHELIVPNLDAARADLLANGCDVIKWEGKGKDCYIRDPFGFMFNIWEDPKAFEE